MVIRSNPNDACIASFSRFTIRKKIADAAAVDFMNEIVSWILFAK